MLKKKDGDIISIILAIVAILFVLECFSFVDKSEKTLEFFINEMQLKEFKTYYELKECNELYSINEKIKHLKNAQ